MLIEFKIFGLILFIFLNISNKKEIFKNKKCIHNKFIDLVKRENISFIKK
jgi:hypothetical protein